MDLGSKDTPPSSAYSLYTKNLEKDAPKSTFHNRYR